MESAVSVRGLRKTYRWGQVEALRGLDLEIGRGQIFGLLGPNGAGKTTLVKLLLGLRRPTAGGATLLGVPAGTAASRRLVGYLPEDHRIAPYLTARQALAIHARLAGHSPRELKPRIDELLTRLELIEAQYTKLRGFSKGMKQRLGLAQALMHRPQLIFLDEPTDGIDPAGRRVVRALLEEAQQGGATILVSSHQLLEIQQLCQRVAVLSRGQLRLEGALEDLLGGGRRWRLAVEGDGAAAAARLEARADIHSQPGARRAGGREWLIEVGSPAALDALIGELVADGVRLRGLAENNSLEEVYLEAVSQAEMS